MSAHPYGEGTMRIDRATDYLIKQARFAKRKWGLTQDAMDLVLKRVLKAETRFGVEGTMNSDTAIARAKEDLPCPE